MFNESTPGAEDRQELQDEREEEPKGFLFGDRRYSKFNARWCENRCGKFALNAGTLCEVCKGSEYNHDANGDPIHVDGRAFYCGAVEQFRENEHGEIIEVASSVCLWDLGACPNEDHTAVARFYIDCPGLSAAAIGRVVGVNPRVAQLLIADLRQDQAFAIDPHTGDGLALPFVRKILDAAWNQHRTVDDVDFDGSTDLETARDRFLVEELGFSQNGVTILDAVADMLDRVAPMEGVPLKHWCGVPGCLHAFRNLRAAKAAEKTQTKIAKLNRQRRKNDPRKKRRIERDQQIRSRHAAGETRAQLVEAYGLTRPTINKILKGNK